IRLWIAKSVDDTVLSGVVMYLTDMVAHAQYIASSPEGFNTNALSGLLNHIIGYYGEWCTFFDFGISTEDHGRYLNEGLVRQKNGLGGRGTVTLSLKISL
ncbi:MAG: GNAT family N-acetyltransferase, partial [Muribaculaceae bacterium]|nr:GNAT family N-acetyltransferase [Muribaculaceae bacterium]